MQINPMGNVLVVDEAPPPRFIAGELSKNWRAGEPASTTGLISQQFEGLINHNFQRGYKLHSFSLSQTTDGADLNETIIAVFERME